MQNVRYFGRTDKESDCLFVELAVDVVSGCTWCLD
jgi:hypothetical protein